MNTWKYEDVLADPFDQAQVLINLLSNVSLQNLVAALR